MQVCKRITYTNIGAVSTTRDAEASAKPNSVPAFRSLLAHILPLYFSTRSLQKIRPMPVPRSFFVPSWLSTFALKQFNQLLVAHANAVILYHKQYFTVSNPGLNLYHATLMRELDRLVRKLCATILIELKCTKTTCPVVMELIAVMFCFCL
jgi:hypothetical protein